MFNRVNDLSQIGDQVIENLKMAIKFKDMQIAERRSSAGSSQPDQEAFIEH